MKSFAIILISLSFGLQAYAGSQELTSLDRENLMAQLNEHYTNLGYRITAVGQLSIKGERELYQVTIHNENDGCSQIVRLNKKNNELKVNFLGEMDCR